MNKNSFERLSNWIRVLTKEHRTVLILSMVFAFVYSIIVFFNHYCFRTYALDLGLYTNAIYDYSHFRWNDATVFKEQGRNLLSDHLDFSLIWLSPFSYLFGQYTLLILQIFFILFGAFGVYQYLQIKTNNKRVAIAGFLHLCLFYGVFSALSFDYHSNVLAAMLLPWLFYTLIQKKYAFSILILCLMLITKESVALWLIAVCLAMMIEFRKDKKAMMFLGLFALGSALYFIVAIKIAMPALSPDGEYSHYKYSVLGSDYGSAFRFVVSHPLETIKILFTNHSGNIKYDWVKTEFYIFILLSGAIVLFFRPAFMLMLSVPLLAKMCYDDPAIWSIDSHYSIEFAPVISIGALTVLAIIKNKNWQNKALFLLCLGSLVITVRLMDHTVYLRDYNRLRIYQKGHYTRAHDIHKIHQAMDLIPDHAAVSAQSPLLPHLAYRDHCYQLPLVKDAEYIIASANEHITYPIQKAELIQLLNDSLHTGRWEALVNNANVSLLKRKSRIIHP